MQNVKQTFYIYFLFFSVNVRLVSKWIQYFHVICPTSFLLVIYFFGPLVLVKRGPINSVLSIQLFVHPSIRISIFSEFLHYFLLKLSRKLGVHISWRVAISFFSGKFVFCLEASNSPQFGAKVWFLKLFINRFIIGPLNYQRVLQIQSYSFIRPFAHLSVQ